MFLRTSAFLLSLGCSAAFASSNESCRLTTTAVEAAPWTDAFVPACGDDCASRKGEQSEAPCESGAYGCVPDTVDVAPLKNPTVPIGPRCLEASPTCAPAPPSPSHGALDSIVLYELPDLTGLPQPEYDWETAMPIVASQFLYVNHHIDPPTPPPRA